MARKTKQSRREIAAYTADMLASLRRLSLDHNLTLLAHLTALARIEALRLTESKAP